MLLLQLVELTEETKASRRAHIQTWATTYAVISETVTFYIIASFALFLFKCWVSK